MNRKWAMAMMVAAGVLGLGAGAIAATTLTGDFQITADRVFNNEPGSTMVVHDRFGNSAYVENGVIKYSKKRGKGGTDAPDPGPPWGVCGGDTTVSCETVQFARSCNIDSTTRGIQNCQQNQCHCIGSDSAYMAASSPACGICFVGGTTTPAQTLPSL